MKLLALILISLVSLCAQAKELKITSLNIRVYGQGGVYTGLPTDEFRDKWIREFLDTKVGDSDVLIFAEIKEKDSFIKNLMGNMNCVSYDYPLNNLIETKEEKLDHMYVIMCFKKQYELELETSDDNFIFEPMAFNYYRPAIYGVLTENKKKLAHIIGVHLKALPQGHKTRTKQIELLANRIKEIKETNDNLPIIVGGDYNTYVDEEIDDLKMINSFFNPLDLFSINHQNLLTYKTPFYSGSFDHFWISQSILGNATFNVYGPCNQTSNGERFDDLFFYNQFVSDHCAASVIVNL